MADINQRPLPWGNSAEYPPLTVKIGETWNQFVFDVRVWRSMELIRFEHDVAKEVEALFSKASQDLLGDLLALRGDLLSRSLQIEYSARLAQVWSATTGTSLEIIEDSLSKVVAHEAAIADELRAVFESYRQNPDFAALPGWRVPPVQAFVSAVAATDPDWFLSPFIGDNVSRTVNRARREILSAHLQGQSFRVSQRRCEKRSRLAKRMPPELHVLRFTGSPPATNASG